MPATHLPSVAGADVPTPSSDVVGSPARPDRRTRLQAILEEVGADVLLAAHGPTVTWLTGYSPEEGFVLSAFESSALAIVPSEGPPTLVVSELEVEPARASGLEVVTYPFSFSPANRPTALAETVTKLIGARSVASELWALPSAVAKAVDPVDVGLPVHRARAIKDPDEIEHIRAAVALCDLGQSAARAAAHDGVSELDVWSAVRGAVERAAGGMVEMRCDLLSGPRTVADGGLPTSRRLKAGDTVLFDLFLRHHGYWGDSSSTFAVGGTPAAALRQRHAEVRSAVERGIDAMQTGAHVRTIDQAIRQGLTFAHLSGHGLGTALHEEPRIAEFNDGVLEHGMVVTVEPGIYGSEHGVRLEQVVLVTHDGPKVLSGHDLSLS